MKTQKLTEKEIQVLEQVRQRFARGLEEQKNAKKALEEARYDVENEGEYFCVSRDTKTEQFEWTGEWEINEIEVQSGREPFLSEIQMMNRLASAVSTTWTDVENILQKSFGGFWEIDDTGIHGKTEENGKKYCWIINAWNTEKDFANWVGKDEEEKQTNRNKE